MPKMSKTNSVATTKKVEVTPTVNSSPVVNTDRDKEIEELKKNNAELMSKLETLMNMMTTIQNSNDVTAKEDNSNGDDVMANISKKYNSDYIPSEINPNKQVMVMSLCYGTLNLTGGGRNTLIQFTKYGEVRPVLYSTLITIVNHNLRFAQTGKFYILDKDSVYHLGLSDFYKKLIPNEIIDNITDYSPNVIESIIKDIDDEQVDLIVKLLSERIYRGENLDANKINLISKLAGKDIMKKVEEMRTYSKR